MEVESHPSPSGRWDDPKREWEGLLELARRHEERGDDVQGLVVREQMLLAAKAAFGEGSEEVLRGCESFVIRCNQRAMRLLQEGRLDEAFTLLRKAEMLTDKNGSLAGAPAARLKSRAVTLNNLGLFYRHRNQQHAALSYLEQALEIESGTSDSHSENPAATLLNLCAVHSALGRHHVSLNYAKKALSSLKKKGSKAAKLGAPIAPSHTAMLAVAHHAIGCQYEGMKVYHKAAAEYVQAVILARQANADCTPYKSAYNGVIHKARLAGKVSEAVLPQLPPDTREAKRPATGNPTARTGAAFRQGLPTVHSAPARRRASATLSRPSTASYTAAPRPTTAGNPPRTSPDGGVLYKQPSLAEQQAAMMGQAGKRKQDPSPYAPRPPSGNPRIRAAKQAYELIYKPAASLSENLSESHKKALQELDKLSKEHLLNAQRELAPPPTEPHVPQQPRTTPVSQVRMGQFSSRTAQAEAYMMEVPETRVQSPVHAIPVPEVPVRPRPQTANIRVQASRRPTTPVASSSSAISPQYDRQERSGSPLNGMEPRMAFQHRHRDTPLKNVPPHVVTASLTILSVASLSCPDVSEEGTSAAPSTSAAGDAESTSQHTDDAPEEVAPTIGEGSTPSESSTSEPSSPEPQREAPMAEVLLEPQPQPHELQPQPRTQGPEVQGTAEHPQHPEPEEAHEEPLQPYKFTASSPLPSPSAVRRLMSDVTAGFMRATTSTPLHGAPRAPLDIDHEHMPGQRSPMTAEQNKELVAKVVALGYKLNDLHEQILRGYAAGGTRIRLEREKARQVREAAALTIQRVWRGSVGKRMWLKQQRQMDEERQRKEERARRRQAATAAIQRAWRMHISRKVVRTLKTEKAKLRKAFLLSSVIVIQAYGRVVLSKRVAYANKMRMLMRAVQLAQARWRGVDARSKFKKLKIDWAEKKKIIEFGSATRIQGWWRKMMTLRAKEENYRRQWEELVSERKPLFAAGRIKLWWKWLTFERTFVSEVRRVSMEKERIRQVEAQVEYLKNLQCKSSVVIQQAFRRYLSMRQLRYLQVTDLERKIAYLEHEEKNHAARVLQAFVRIVKAKSSMERRRKEVAEFEALKAWKKEKEVQREAELEAMRRVTRAAVKLQSVWRGYHLRLVRYNKRLAELLEWESERGIQVTKVTKVWKGYRVRKELGGIVGERVAIKRIQKAGRGWHGRRETAGQFVVRVQAWCRTKLSQFETGYRRQVCLLEQTKREYLATLSLQRWWRSVVVHKQIAHTTRLRALRNAHETRHLAATTIQALYRGICTRRTRKMLIAVHTIQRFMRRSLASLRVARRKEEITELLRVSNAVLENSLLVVQAFARQRLSRFLTEAVMKERTEDMKKFYEKRVQRSPIGEYRWRCASAIQRAWKCHRARAVAKARRCVLVVQRVGRGYLSRRKALAAVIVLQAFARGKVSVQVRSARIVEVVSKATVDAIMGKVIARLEREERRIIARSTAIATLQRAFRTVIARQLVSQLRSTRAADYQDMIQQDAASVIQRFAALNRATVIVDAMRLQTLRKLHGTVENDAAALIQATFKGWAVRQKYLKGRRERAALTIALAMKTNLARRRTARLRDSRAADRCDTVRAEAAGIIKSFFLTRRGRRHLAVSVADRASTHEQIVQTEAASVIQQAYHRHAHQKPRKVAQKELLQYEAATTIQAFYRGEKARWLFRRMQAACVVQRAWRVCVAKRTVARVRREVLLLLEAQEAEEDAAFMG